VYPQLAKDHTYVRPNRPRADVQSMCDLPVGATFTERVEHLALPICQKTLTRRDSRSPTTPGRQVAVLTICSETNRSQDVTLRGVLGQKGCPDLDEHLAPQTPRIWSDDDDRRRWLADFQTRQQPIPHGLTHDRNLRRRIHHETLELGVFQIRDQNTNMRVTVKDVLQAIGHQRLEAAHRDGDGSAASLAHARFVSCLRSTPTVSGCARW
jgi:hypothetical protein